ncbi:hypothetical protein QUF90_27585 [Desulfococcaceae bacterium HSG9]|nr:hypothetical protein [Desulfococcaceae bacterium HSG9]
MKSHNRLICPDCGSSETSPFKKYHTLHNGGRQLYLCGDCNTCFSETKGTAMENLKFPIGKVASALHIHSERMGLRATARVLGACKRTVSQWEERFSDQKETSMLYAFCHEFVSLTFEGDEIHTIAGKRGEPAESEGQTAVIMERRTRFIVDQ